MKIFRVVFIIAVCLSAIFLIATVSSGNSDAMWNWGMLSFIIIMIAISAFIVFYELRCPSTREIALISTLTAVAALGRVPFAALPNIQPTTFIVIVSGYVFGPQIGFMVGAFAGFVSNIFLGHGPWTPWQMFAWGAAGASGAALSRVIPDTKPVVLAVFCGIWGFIFGGILNIWQWAAFVFPLNMKTFIATYASSFVFDAMHALGNVAFSLVFGSTLIKILKRFKEKLHVDYR